MKKFIEELKRRNVIKASLAYLVIAWVLLQVATTLLDIIHSPEWVIQTLTVILILGLPIWIIIYGSSILFCSKRVLLFPNPSK
jgi:adenylate cyclase